MSIANLKKLQKISHRLNVDKTEVATQFVSTLKAALAKRGYRADLQIATDAKSTAGRFTAAVRFDTQLGHPAEEDLVTLVAKTYPTHEIEWDMAQVDSDQGIVLISLAPATESIPIKSMNDIPPEFVAIGTGIYKRAVDSTVNEIWTLKRSEDGLLLYRNNDDIEVKADEGDLKAGDIANTPYGPGRILRFDDYGNAFVQIGNQKRLVAGKELGMYSVEKEKKLLENYYAESYGDLNFAKELVKDYTTRKDNKKSK